MTKFNNSKLSCFQYIFAKFNGKYVSIMYKHTFPSNEVHVYLFACQYSCVLLRISACLTTASGILWIRVFFQARNEIISSIYPIILSSINQRKEYLRFIMEMPCPSEHRNTMLEKELDNCYIVVLIFTLCSNDSFTITG